MDAERIKQLDQQYVLHTYNRAPFVLERGQGMYLYDTEGKAYLDFVSGIAVNALGHGHPAVLEAIAEQARKLLHVSNLYHTIPQAELAQMLVDSSFADKVYFCNSGAESVEAAIKFARKWARANYGEERTEFIAMDGAFHGRTIGALALTPRPHYQDPFRPLMPGVRLATFNDLDSVKALLDERVCAVFVEPLQGEGGVNPATSEFLRGLRELCDRNGSLLVFDEVQCGMGRTGTLWAHQFYGITPDIMTVAKPIGGGLPMGVTFLTQRVADAIEPGDHASTFAANPLICAVAQKVFGIISNPEFLAHVRGVGAYLEKGLQALADRVCGIRQVRGRGLIWGLELDGEALPIIQRGYEKGLLTLNAGPKVLRLLPPLVVERQHIDQALEILEACFEQQQTN